MESNAGHNRFRLILGGVVLGYVLFIQLIGIQRPFLGHYASYQGTVMASIARNMVRENFSEIFLPKTDLVVEGQRSLHLNQFPLPSLLTACGVKFAGGSYEFWGRFQAIVFNFLSILLLSFIAKRFFGEEIGFISTVIFALSPLTIIYGQSLMSEPSSLFFFLMSLYLLLCQNRWFLLTLFVSAVCMAAALTGRIHWVLFLPFAGLLVWRAREQGRFKNLVIFCLLSVSLPVLWYGYTYFASLHASNLHTNFFVQAATSEKGIEFFLHKDIYRAVGLILGKSMLAFVMVPFFLVGLRPSSRCPQGRFCLIAGFAVTALTMILSPGKLVRHDFYLYFIFPFFAVVVAMGVLEFLHWFPKRRMQLGAILFLTGLAASFLFSFRPLYRVSRHEQEMLRAAAWTRERTLPNDSLIVTGNEPTLAFYTDRPCTFLVPNKNGKTISPYFRMTAFTGRDPEAIKRLEEASQDPIRWLEYLRGQGATCLLITNPGLFRDFPEFLPYVKSRYQSISGNQASYQLYRLEDASQSV